MRLSGKMPGHQSKRRQDREGASSGLEALGGRQVLLDRDYLPAGARVLTVDRHHLLGPGRLQHLTPPLDVRLILALHRQAIHQNAVAVGAEANPVAAAAGVSVGDVDIRISTARRALYATNPGPNLRLGSLRADSRARLSTGS